MAKKSARSPISNEEKLEIIEKWCTALHHADRCQDTQCGCAKHAAVLIHLIDCVESSCKMCNFLMGIGDHFKCACEEGCPIASVLEDRRTRLFEIFEDVDLLDRFEHDKRLKSER